MLEPNSPIQIGELSKGAEIGGMMAKTGGLEADYGSSAIQIAEIRQLELTNLPNFPLAEFLSIGFTHYIMQDFRQPMGVATYKTADEIDPDLLKALPPKEELERLLEPGEGQR